MPKQYQLKTILIQAEESESHVFGILESEPLVKKQEPEPLVTAAPKQNWDTETKKYAAPVLAPRRLNVLLFFQ